MDTLFLPNFYKALDDLAPTNAERARVLKVSRATVIEWRRGTSLQTITPMLKVPGLLRALADDAEALQIPETETAA